MQEQGRSILYEVQRLSRRVRAANQAPGSSSRTRLPPLVGGSIPYLGYALHYGLRGPEILARLRAEHGDIFRLRLLGMEILCAFSAEFTERFYGAPHADMSFFEALRSFLGFSSVIPLDSTGPEEANVGLETLRRFLTPRVASLTEELDTHVRAHLRRVASGGPLEVREALAGGIIGQSALLLAGERVANDEAFIAAMTAFDVATQALSTALFTRRAAQRAIATKAAVMRILSNDIACRCREASTGAGQDFIDAMLAQGLHGGGIAEDVLGFLFGTTANTPAAATMTLLHILAEPDLLTRVRSEIEERVSRTGGVITTSALKQLAVLDACLNETLRLYAPGLHLRYLLREMEIGAYRVPARSLVAVSPYLIHRDPRVYTDPDVFDPDRFLAGPRLPGRKPSSLSFVPFGRGLHACVGRALARTEILLMVARIVHDYEVTLIPHSREVAPDWGTTGVAVPRRRVRMQLRAR